MQKAVRGIKVVGLVCVATTVAWSSLGDANAQKGGRTSVEGLGEAWPAGPNLSVSVQFSVFRWLQGDIPVFQINRADGTVLAVFALGASGPVSFGIGASANKVRSGVGSLNDRSVGSGYSSDSMTAASGQCPCKSETVYDDGTNVIVVVTDKNGNVIGIYTFTKTKPR